MSTRNPLRSSPVLRRLGAATGAVTLGASLALVGATAANAGPVAPNCIHVLKIDRDWAGFPRATARNDCSSLQRVKIVWASAPDSKCNIAKPHATFSDTTGVFGEFAGLQRC